MPFAAAVHHLYPTSSNGFPEGQGGLLGIATSAYLQSHFNSVGTCLVLFVAPEAAATVPTTVTVTDCVST